MNIILCCSTTSLRERWLAALKSGYSIYQAPTLQDLRILVEQKISFDLLIVHRPLLDLDIVAYIRNTVPACRLFILSDRPDEEEGLDFIRLGVIGYANSYATPQRLQEAVRVVVSGAVWIHQRLIQRLIADSRPAHQGDTAYKYEAFGKSTLQHLSNREYQIAGLVAGGLSNLEIAEQLGITERTVKAHLSAVYAKTSTSGRLGLALLVNQPGRALAQ